MRIRCAAGEVLYHFNLIFGPVRSGCLDSLEGFPTRNLGVQQLDSAESDAAGRFPTGKRPIIGTCRHMRRVLLRVNVRDGSA